MKSHLLRTSLVALIAAAAGFGQSGTVHATIPFDFVTGTSKLPQGRYTLVQRGPSGIVSLHSVHPNAGVVVMATNSGKAHRRDECKLVFHRYGNVYFLSEIWMPDSALELAETKRERQLAANARALSDSISVAVR